MYNADPVCQMRILDMDGRLIDCVGIGQMSGLESPTLCPLAAVVWSSLLCHISNHSETCCPILFIADAVSCTSNAEAYYSICDDRTMPRLLVVDGVVTSFSKAYPSDAFALLPLDF